MLALAGLLLPASVAVAVPDVPYLPQTESLCGGAALAMVLRYWGARAVRPADFASALSARGDGIPAETLRELAEERGYQALAFRAEASDALAQLAQGRPLIALADGGRRGYHYVVLLAWSNGRVLLHDPALGPFRVIPEAEWLRRWDAAGRWALLVLPQAADAREDVNPQAVDADAAGEACASRVRPAIESADRGDLDSARRELAAAAEACPDSSAPLRELAGLELRSEDWAGAAELAERAVSRSPDDALAWRVLATSRFLAGRPEAALSAWNRVGEPRLDIVRIDGLARTPFRTVYDSLGREDDELLTPRALRWTERRVAALPSTSGSRVSYRPLPGGRAELEVAVVERPTIDPPAPLLVESAIRAFTDHAVALSLANLSAAGDSVRAFWRWQPNRPRLALSASAPRALGLPGIVTTELVWDEQSYRLAPGGPETGLVREGHRRASLAVDDWWRVDSKLGATLAVDEWSERGRSLSISGRVEQRLAADRISLGGSASAWAWRSGPPFYAGSLRLSARSRATLEVLPLVRFDLTYEAASALAPLALWPGAGTGLGRDLLLRAHPLLHDGVVDGRCFGRHVLRGGVEALAPAVRLGPVGLSAAVFVDSARVLVPAPGASSQSFVDVGAGLRARVAGGRSTLRADVATPWGSLRPRLSVGWQAPWPD